MEFDRFRGSQLIQGARDDGGLVGQKESEDLATDLARELEERKGHCSPSDSALCGMRYEIEMRSFTTVSSQGC